MTTTLDLPRCALRLPDFVSRKVAAHYDRVRNEWGGGHLCHGATPGPGALLMMSNDYLDLLPLKALRMAQAESMFEDVAELLMSAVFLHGDSSQANFERRLARYMQAEDGVVCQSGWAANVGLIQTLAGPGVPVYLDIAAHASLWEGVQSAGAKPVRFLHNRVEHARLQVAEHGPGVIGVDSVYSTNGSVAPLVELTQLAEESGSILVVDESHSLGTHGPEGSGLVCEFGLAERVPFRTASLAKAFAGRAGFIACSSEFKGYFNTTSRQAVFSSALFEHEIAWFEAALSFISAADERRERLHSLSRRLRQELAALGYNVFDGTEQIIGLEAGSEPQTLRLRDALQRRGIFGAPFAWPATAKNRSLVRLTLNVGHSDDDVDRLVRACADMRDEVDLTNWSSTRRLQRATAQLTSPHA